MDRLSGSARLMIVSDLDHTMVDHHDPENMSLLRFNALWESMYRHDSLLVFSTGRSAALYKELRKEKPMLTPDITIMSVGTEITYGENMVPDDGWEHVLNDKWDRSIVVEEASKFPQLKFQAETEQRPHKVSFYVEKVHAQQVTKSLSKILEKRGLDVKIIYSGGIDLDILAKGAGKGQALAYLLNKFNSGGKTPNNTLVCGDSGNDAELFSIPGVYGVMVSNAQEELLQWHAENAKDNPRIIHAAERCAGGIIQAKGHFRLGPNASPRDAVDSSPCKPDALNPALEVVKLYIFYERWHRAEVENSKLSIQKLDSVIDPTGIIVHPSGVERSLRQCIKAFEQGYADQKGKNFRVWVDRVFTSKIGSDAWLVKFNKWELIGDLVMEALENSRREITIAMMKSYPQLLGKYIADKAKVSSLVEIIVHLKLELYSLKRQEQNLKSILELITDAFFKHGEKDILRSCIKAITFCSVESQSDLQDYAQNKLKNLENELIVKLKSAMKQVAVGDDEYSLLVNLKRLYEFQLTKCVSNDGLFEDMVSILKDVKDIDNEVVTFLLLNMYLHVAWCLQSIDSEDSSDSSVTALLSKRTVLLEQLENYTNILSDKEGKRGNLLSSRVCIILAEMWCLFKMSRFTSTNLESLGYCPEKHVLQKFWMLCEQQFNISDETEDEGANDEYIEETNRDAVMIAAAKLVASGTVPKDYLGPEIVSHFVMHGTSISEIIKHLISFLKKNANDYIPLLFLEPLKRAYKRHVVDLTKSHDESLSSKSFSDCKDLANRLSGTFVGAARNKYKSDILKIVKEGILFAFVDPPTQLSFLEGAVLPFISKLPPSDVLDILKDVQKRSENVNTDEDPSGWRPYFTFVDYLNEKYTKNEGLQDEKEGSVKRRGRPRKARNIQGKKLFEEQASSEEDSISTSEHNDQDGEEDEEEQQPLIHTFRSSASKLRSMRIPPQDTDTQAGTSRTSG